MKLALKIASRFLKSSKMQTLLVGFVIGVGVSVQIFLGSLIGGLQKDLVNTTIGNTSQVTVANINTGYIENYSTTISDLYEVSDNIKIVSESVTGVGTAIKNLDSNQIILKGVNFTNANKIYEFDERLTLGTLPNSLNQIAIGIGVFEELNLNLNDTIELDIPLVGSTTATVVGVLDFEVSQINNSWVVSNLATAQSVLGLLDQLTQIEMQIKDVFLAEETSALVANYLNDETNYEVTNWIQSNASLLSGLEAQSSSSLTIQVFIMISVVLAIISVLAISVVQKGKQIGILKAMGIKDRNASFVFLFQGLILGIFGAIAGVALGLGLSYVFTTFAVDPSGNPVVNLFIDPNFIAVSAAIAVLASTVAAIIPARKSSKLSVIEVIRNG